MEMEILKQLESPLLSRTRVTAKVSSAGPTPSQADIRKALATKLKAAEEAVAVRHIYTRFGSTDAKVIAHVYESETKLKETERQTRKQRRDAKETAKKALEEHKAKKAEEAKAAATPAPEGA